MNAALRNLLTKTTPLTREYIHGQTAAPQYTALVQRAGEWFGHRVNEAAVLLAEVSDDFIRGAESTGLWVCREVERRTA